MPCEVDHVGRGVQRGEELCDSHLHVAVHIISHNLRRGGRSCQWPKREKGGGRAETARNGGDMISRARMCAREREGGQRGEGRGQARWERGGLRGDIEGPRGEGRNSGEG